MLVESSFSSSKGGLTDAFDGGVELFEGASKRPGQGVTPVSQDRGVGPKDAHVQFAIEECDATTVRREDVRVRTGPVSLATIRTGRLMVASGRIARQNRRVLEITVVVVRALALACRGHHELVLENLALRQQLNALRRTGKRPYLRCAIDSFGSCWPTHGGTGVGRSCSSSLIPS
jgi:hypothetical protein